MSQSKVLDLKGFVCPFTQIKTLKALHKAPSGTALNVLVDNPGSLESIIIAAENAGYKVEQVVRNGNVFAIKINKAKKNVATPGEHLQKRDTEHRSQMFGVDTREIALISVFSALWIASEIMLGDIIGQTFGIHGVVQRLVGWLLMPILAELTGRFGRVSLMAAIAALATRMIRRSASLYIWMVGLGYALGGLAFDLLFFIPLANNLEGKKRKIYLLTISLASGTAALIPYVLYRLFTFILSSEAWFYIFIAWMLGPPSFYAIDAVKSIVLNVLGTLVGMSIMPPIRAALPNFPARIRSYTE